MSIVPDSMPGCGAREGDWGLVCFRPPLHEGRHYGANVAGTHEGYWGEGILHVSRTLRRTVTLQAPVEPDKMSV